MRAARVGVLAAVCVALTAPAATAGSTAPSAAGFMQEAAFAHNTMVDDDIPIQLSIVGQASGFCTAAEAANGAPGSAMDWKIVEGAGQNVEHAVKSDRTHNADLEGWPAELRRALAGRTKAQKTAIGQAIADLGRAYAEHGAEFYHLDAVGNDLVARRCEAVMGEVREAAAAGEKAWVDEAAGLKKAAAALGFRGRISEATPYSCLKSGPFALVTCIR